MEQILAVRQWAEDQWQGVDLHDARLDRRAVMMGWRMAQQPAASLAEQMADWAELRAAYRLLDNAAVSHVALSQPHWAATRQAAGEQPLVLLVMDITQVDLTRYAKTMADLAPIGDGKGQGLLVHSTLAVLPETRRVLGLAHQQVFKRRPLADPAKRRERPKAERESRVWGEAAQALGRPAAGSRWVVVGDIATDNLDFLLTCQATGLDFNLRLGHDHRLIGPAAPPSYLMSEVRTWPAVTQQTVTVAASKGQPARQAQVWISYGAVTLRSRPQRREGLGIWVVHAWETNAPPGAVPVEWFIGTTVAVSSSETALERLAWYTCRWLVEDYHQCLKTGCQIEHRDLEQASRIERLLGFLAPVAVRLLQLRQESRQDPEQPAADVVDPALIQILARHLRIDAAQMTVYGFWRRVAQLGGFLGRRSDGEPGWRTIWRGWQKLSLMATGAALAAAPPP